VDGAQPCEGAHTLELSRSRSGLFARFVRFHLPRFRNDNARFALLDSEVCRAGASWRAEA
jgi:hypothetical protein